MRREDAAPATGADSRRRTRTSALFDAYPHLYGGAQQISHRLALDLRRTGWRSRFVLPGEGAFAERLRADRLDVTVLPAPRALSLYGGSTRGRRALEAIAAMGWWTARLRRVFARVELVHANDPRGILLAGPAARLARRPLIWHLHVVSSRPVANRIGAALADATVAVSRSALAAMPELAPRAELEPNPLPRELFGVERGPSAPAPIVVTAGRLHPDKGTDLLVAAMGRVIRRHPGARLLILGSAQLGWERYAADLRSQATRLGVASQIELRGWVERPAEHWRRAWVYVQPSRSESYGLALVEAMASGLPAVASDIDGLRELVRHGETGLLVQPGDVAGLADAIGLLLADRALATRLGDAARVEARRATVDPVEYARRWAARYERLAGGP